MKKPWFQWINANGQWYGSASRLEDDPIDGPGARSSARDAARSYGMVMTLRIEDESGEYETVLETWHPDGRCEPAATAPA